MFTILHQSTFYFLRYAHEICLFTNIQKHKKFTNFTGKLLQEFAGYYFYRKILKSALLTFPRAFSIVMQIGRKVSIILVFSIPTFPMKYQFLQNHSSLLLAPTHFKEILKIFHHPLFYY